MSKEVTQSFFCQQSSVSLVHFSVNFLSHELPADKVLVDTVDFQELFMSATFFHLTMLHHNDFICIADSTESMGDHDYGLLARLDQLIQSLLHLVLALGVEGRSCLVEEEYFRFADQGTRNRNPLLLATGELNAALTNHSVVLEREQGLVMDEVEGVRLVTSIVHHRLYFLSGLVPKVETIDDVLTDGTGEQNRFLLDDGDLIMVPLGVKLFDVASIEEDFALNGVVEPLD